MSARSGLRSSITVRKNAQNWPYFHYLNVVDAVFFAFFGRRLILNGQNGTLTVEILKPKNVGGSGMVSKLSAKPKNVGGSGIVAKFVAKPKNVGGSGMVSKLMAKPKNVGGSGVVAKFWAVLNSFP